MSTRERQSPEIQIQIILDAITRVFSTGTFDETQPTANYVARQVDETFRVTQDIRERAEKAMYAALLKNRNLPPDTDNGPLRVMAIKNSERFIRQLEEAIGDVPYPGSGLE